LGGGSRRPEPDRWKRFLAEQRRDHEQNEPEEDLPERVREDEVIRIVRHSLTRGALGIPVAREQGRARREHGGSLAWQRALRQISPRRPPSLLQYCIRDRTSGEPPISQMARLEADALVPGDRTEPAPTTPPLVLHVDWNG